MQPRLSISTKCHYRKRYYYLLVGLLNNSHSSTVLLYIFLYILNLRSYHSVSGVDPCSVIMTRVCLLLLQSHHEKMQIAISLSNLNIAIRPLYFQKRTEYCYANILYYPNNKQQKVVQFNIRFLSSCLLLASVVKNTNCVSTIS